MTCIREIIVVEGKSDVSAVRRAVDAEMIITSGFGITEETFQLIAAARRQKGVVIFTDPDHAGDQIRRRINSRVPGCKNAFLTRDEANKKGKKTLSGLGA
ncbi:MAG: toprim domain-containing protein [Desulfobacterales bacterium]|nr:toprim domain-containing protein [Desulfobacterales bacterium]